ncbi:MAG: V-type ATP synthase subunit D [Candidatus Bathyarchaeia archaeon]
MSEVIPGIHPTRMELLALRKRRDIAERGRDLLREKLDALMIELFENVRQIAELRERSHALLREAYDLFTEAGMVHGLARLEQFALGVEDRFELDTKTRNVIGVTLPEVQVKVSPIRTAPYNLLATSAKLDEATMKMTEAVKAITELSSAEASTRKLAEAIASTKRRVNSLDYVIIPRVLHSIRYIQMHLEEREREDFFRLKRIKSRMQKKGSTA